MVEAAPQTQIQPTPQPPPYIGYVPVAPAANLQQASNNVNDYHPIEAEFMCLAPTIPLLGR